MLGSLWPAGKLTQWEENRYKSSSRVSTFISLVPEYKPRYELKLGGAITCLVSHSASFSRFQQLAFPNVAVSSTGRTFFTSEKQPDMQRERKRS